MERVITAVFIALMCAFVLILLFPSMVLDGMHSMQTDSRTDTFAAVTTGVAETTGDVILLEELYNDKLGSILQIDSNNTSDTPTIVSYNTVTRTLTVGGLVASDTRSLVIEYEIDGLANFPELATLSGTAPLLIFFGIIFLVIGGIWAAFKTRSAIGMG